MNPTSHRIAARLAAPRIAALSRAASPDSGYLETFVKLLLRDLETGGAQVPEDAQWDLSKYLRQALGLENLAKVGKPLPGGVSVHPSVWVGSLKPGEYAAQVTLVYPYLHVDGTKIVEAGLRKSGVEGDVRKVLAHPSSALLGALHDAVSSAVLRGAPHTRPLMKKLQQEGATRAKVKAALDRRARELFDAAAGEWEYAPYDASVGIHLVEGPGMSLRITLHGLVNIRLEDFGAGRTARRRTASWPRNLDLAGLLKALDRIPNVRNVRHSGASVTFNYGHAPLVLQVSEMNRKILWYVGPPGTRGTKMGDFLMEPTSAKNLKILMAGVKTALASFDPNPAATTAPSLDSVTSELRGIHLGPGGRAVSVQREHGMWDIEPAHRQRLDHYGTRYNDNEDEDEDEEGWDEDGWEMAYAGPVRSAAKKWLADTFKPGLFSVDVDDKGFVMVTLTPAGKTHFGGKV